MAALQEWCRRELASYPGLHIRDMSSSWRDGLAFCALIHRYRPGLLDYASLDPADWHGWVIQRIVVVTSGCSLNWSNVSVPS